MAENSGIEWTDHTFNPWIGCQKVSEACRFCYAESSVNRYGGDFHGRRVVTSDANWKKPLKWNRDYEWQRQEVLENHGPTLRRPRVFCASWADVFEDWKGQIVDNKGRLLFTINGDEWFTEGEYPDCRWVTMADVRRRLFKLIDATPHLDYLLLTKRPENVQRMWPAYFPGGYIAEAGSMNQEVARPNVWLGCTVENQEQADKRIPCLMDCRELAPVLFLSCEPLLGPVDLTRIEGKIGIGLHSYDVLNGQNIHWDDDGQWTPCDKIDWVIAGGESGPNARPSHPDWFRSLRDQCNTASIPFFFKQWGEWVPFATTAFPSDAELREGGPCGGPSVLHDFKIKDGVQTCRIGYASQTEVSSKRQYELRQLDEPWGKGKHTQTVVRVGKKAAGRLLDGVIHDEFPKVNQ